MIDPVVDYDATAGRTSTESADAVVNFVEAEGVALQWLLETHVRAYHLTAAPYIKEKPGGKIGIGANVTIVQAVFKGIFNLQDVHPGGSQFDELFNDGDSFAGRQRHQLSETLNML